MLLLAVAFVWECLYHQDTPSSPSTHGCGYQTGVSCAHPMLLQQLSLQLRVALWDALHYCWAPLFTGLLSFFFCRPSIMVRLALGPPHRSSLWSLTRAPPTSGCHPSTAPAKPAVSRGSPNESDCAKWPHWGHGVRAAAGCRRCSVCTQRGVQRGQEQRGFVCSAAIAPPGPGTISPREISAGLFGPFLWEGL